MATKMTTLVAIPRTLSETTPAARMSATPVTNAAPATSLYPKNQAANIASAPTVRSTRIERDRTRFREELSSAIEEILQRAQ